MGFIMSETEPLYEESVNGQKELTAASFFNRFMARTIDLIIVVALYEIIPSIGYFAALIYLLIADGLFEGRSVGKKLIGLKVVLQNDTEIIRDCGYKESIFRNFPFAVGLILCGIFGGIPLIGWLISFIIIGIILAFESLVIIGSNNGKRLGDEIANTQVVEEEQGRVNDT
jgi:uncharacterized RDD family membrane protein YckC